MKLNRQPPDLTQDLDGFQLPAEDVTTDEVGQKAPAFGGRLIGKMDAIEPFNRDLASEDQCPDRPQGEGYGRLAGGVGRLTH